MQYMLIPEAQSGNVTFLAVHAALQQSNLMHMWKMVSLKLTWRYLAKPRCIHAPSGKIGSTYICITVT